MASMQQFQLSGFVLNIVKTDVLNLVIPTALLKISRYIRAKIMQSVALFQLSAPNKVKKLI